jgi:mono/diheme cytochrome c family protein
MRSMIARLTLAAALVAASAVAAQAASADKGRKAFADYGCWSCHGYEGQGAVTGPKLGPDPLPKEGFVAFVRSTNQTMPPYHESVLPDADMDDIYAFLESRPKPADPKGIPLLNP